MRTPSILLALVATSTLAAAAPHPDYAIIPSGTASFMPLDPKRPDGGKLAIVSGDPKRGPVAVLLKLPRGPSPIHWHSSDYYAVLVDGKTKHWLPGKEAAATTNERGTVWVQPGGMAATAHGDECVADSCTIFVFFPTGIDLIPVAK